MKRTNQKGPKPLVTKQQTTTTEKVKQQETNSQESKVRDMDSLEASLIRRNIKACVFTGERQAKDNQFVTGILLWK